MTRVVVIGAGPAGLVAAIRLAEGGARVALLNKGTAFTEDERDVVLADELLTNDECLR